MQITGNTILITGGGSGIGRALAEAFHRLDNHVIITGRRQELLQAVTAANPGMKSLALDVRDPAKLKSFTVHAAAQFPKLNVLINNAGIMKTEDLKKTPIDLTDVEATIETNLLAPIRLTAALLPLLRAQSHAAVVTVSSGLAFLPLAMTPTYCATKAAIHSYTQSLRHQLRDTSVQVIELIPPYVQTELMGPRQAGDPNAMPLKDFIAETMKILETSPQSTEICVERVKPLRFAEANGSYDAFFQRFNEAMTAAAAAH
jgi:uncharacterized oxidoreductase